MLKVLLISLSAICIASCSTQLEFLEQVEKDRAAGAKWYYVGSQPPDPKAKSLPLVPPSPGLEFILWKLFF